MDNDLLIAQHQQEKRQSTEFKERRFNQWNENYTLYRDKVFTNRLTQRQAVNIPIIRDTIQNWMSKVDETPELTFETRSRANRDKDKEIILNEIWEHTYEKNKLDLLDNMDKKIVGLQGRSFKYWYWSQKDGCVKCAVIDPYDIDIDQRVNTLDINTAFYFNHKNIFRPLREILANKSYTNEGKQALKIYLDTKQGLLAASKVHEEVQARRERLENLGVNNYDEYRASDVMVELNRSYKLLWDKSSNTFVRHLIIIALDNVILYNKPCKEAIGYDGIPFSSWASDPDLNDFWSDGIADNVRQVNKIVNTYFSQDLENRAYRNFGMYFYNTLDATFVPRGFDAKPWGMYGVPGNPRDIMEQVRIEPLGDTTQAIEYFKNLIQSSVAQTPTERGIQEKNAATLGEVQLSFQQSQTRNEVVAKQYRNSWLESGKIFYELLANNSQGRTKLAKKSTDGMYYEKTVDRSDWYNPEGYEVQVRLNTEKSANDDLELKKLAYVKQSFQNNPTALKIAKQKELDLIGWSQDEIDQIMQAEEQQMNPQMALPAGQPMEQLPEEVMQSA
jgi:hypothetical protein